MKRQIAGVCGAVALLCVTPGRAEAQTAQPISVQLSTLYEGLAGDAFERVRPGMGFEAQLRYTRGAWSIGLGYQRTQHNYTRCELAASGGGCILPTDGHMTGTGVFLEPRYVFDAGSDVFAPYMSGRFSIVGQNSAGDRFYSDFSVTGSSANGGGGLLFRVTQRINFDAGATVGYTRFSRGRAVDRQTGAVITGLAGGTSGSNFVVRVGIAIGIG